MLGSRIREARKQQGLTQAGLAVAAEATQADVSKIERGVRCPSGQLLQRLAQALRCDPVTLRYGGGGGEEDDMHRRTVLAAGIGVGGAVLVGAASPAQAAPSWARALYTRSCQAPAPHQQLMAGLDLVAGHMSAARYAQAEQLLPRVISGAKAYAGRGGRRGDELLARTYALTAAHAVKERHPDALVAAGYAVSAAERAQHPLASAMAARAQAIALRQHGRHEQAQFVVDQAVAELAAEEEARPVLGHLLLESSYLRAQAGLSEEAQAHWAYAQELSARGPAVGAWRDHPGPLNREQVERYALCMHHVLGDSRRALAQAERLNPRTTAVPHTAARMRHDMAKLLLDAGKAAEALRLLQDLDAHAPQDARRTSVRRMVHGMQRTTPRMPGLQEFADSLSPTA